MYGSVKGWPRGLLRLEGLAVLGAASVAYAWLGGAWWLFAALFFVPDLCMLGYLAGPRVGAALYNIAHWYVLPLVCIAWGVSTEALQVLEAGLVWAAHIGFDRSLGYGLKYADGFGATHLGRMGKAPADA